MLEPRLFARLQEKRDNLHRLHPLPAVAVRRLTEEIYIEWTYNSNALDGNTLTLQETHLVLETGVAIGGRSLREHLEILTHRDAIYYVESLVASDEPVTPFHIRQIHNLVLTRLHDSNAGEYRKLPAYASGLGFELPDTWQVPRLMSDWGEWLAGPATRLEPIVRAAIAHQGLMAIHPFLEGNGRTARLAMNLLLMRDGYPPIIIQRINHGQYYRALTRAQEGDEKPLVNFLGRAAERSLTRYLEACSPNVAPPSAKDEWIPLRKAARGTPYSQDYLSLLARTGRLEAIKKGRNWYTTRRAVAAYQDSVAD
jgi:Fic family protein